VKSLAYHARQLKGEKYISKCWVADCKVHVLLPNESKARVIMHLDAIQEIRDKGPQPIAYIQFDSCQIVLFNGVRAEARRLL
jgi:hypothetical protein